MLFLSRPIRSPDVSPERSGTERVREWIGEAARVVGDDPYVVN